MTATDIEILEYEKELSFMNDLLSKCQSDVNEKKLITKEITALEKRISHLRSINETERMELLYD
jgi:predicted RNase H-like nuclease (RuvC/YqgF family)